MAVVVIPPPSDLTILDECADWLELVTLVADDGNASAGDLERVIRRSGVFGSSSNEDEAIEGHVASVLMILSDRASYADTYYPFIVEGFKVQKRTPYSEGYLTYIFCLCLSYFRKAHPKLKGTDPRLLFELVSAAALEGYLGTEDSLVFGTGRISKFNKDIFKNSVNELASLIGEGDEFLDQPTLSKKDDHLDVVAVKHFPDKQAGKIIVFGQCATGENWNAKLTELDPAAFCRQWMKKPIDSTPSLMKGFFVPFIVPSERWRYTCNYGGILFERLRVTRYAPQGKTIKNSQVAMQTWITSCLV